MHAIIVPNLPALEAHAKATNARFDDAYVETTLRREVETLGEELAPYKRVKRVIVRKSEFAKTTTGKIRRGPGVVVTG